MKTNNFKDSQSSEKVFKYKEEPQGSPSRMLIATMICQGFSSNIGFGMAPAGDPKQSVEFAYLLADEILRQGNLN